MELSPLTWLPRPLRPEELTALLSCNDMTAAYGLALTPEMVCELMTCRNESLKKYQRVEFGAGILHPLIYTFCDSPYLIPEHYVEQLERLQDIFYEFKNEAEEKLTDGELLHFMREQFDEICMGDLDYLEGTCLPIFTEAIRAGFSDYQASEGRLAYGQLDEVPRWDKDLYLEALRELCWS